MSQHPAEVSTVRCMAAPCEQVRKQANHWFIVWKDRSDGMFHCIAYSAEVFGEIGEAAKPVCGSACAQRLFEKFLTDGEI